MADSILVVAPHPDDETLGCGGTLLRHKSNGDDISWLIATDISEESGYTEQEIKQRNDEIKKVSTFYGFDVVKYLNLETTKVDQYSLNDIVSRISKVINDIQPNILYLPFKYDVHSDHRVLFDACYSCTKNFRYPSIRKIYMYETLSETEFAPSLSNNYFVPNVFVDVMEFFHKKMEIVKVYSSELGEFPFPRSIESIEALARFRGSTAGCEYAESFMLLKEIR